MRHASSPSSTHYILTLAFLSKGLMMNFLSLNETFLISLQGKPIFGVSLEGKDVPVIQLGTLHVNALIFLQTLEAVLT